MMQYLANRPQGVATCDVQGLFWSDIDTIEDHRSADEHIRSAPRSSAYDGLVSRI